MIFSSPGVRLERREDGAAVLSSLAPLEAFSRCIGEWLVHWAVAAPERAFLMERSASGPWVGISYAKTLQDVGRIGAWLLQQAPRMGQTIAVLSGNSIEHALLCLAAMHVGIPVLPVSPAYSLASTDFLKLKMILSCAEPAVIFVSDAEQFAPALTHIKPLHRAKVVVGTGSRPMPGTVPFADLLRTAAGDAAQRAFSRITSDTVAKLLFTSGSTGEPKGVINTQRMLCSNQQAMVQIWPFLQHAPLLMVDWLPWNHTFGGNFVFNMVLRNGGTLYIDGGRPLPGLFDLTLANLREIAPTIYFNVPRAYDLLVAALRSDEALRSHFFSRLQMIFYAAAALPQNLWDALDELAKQTVGERIPLTSGWGATETAPAVTACGFPANRSGVIGLPIPGTEIKLISNDAKLEARVRGANVTPGYWGRPELTQQHFDAEGFYRIGDALRFADESQPGQGLLFDGRVAEDFKLMTGTWVRVGNLRLQAIEALAPLAQDVVIAGHDRTDVCFLVFPNIAACRMLCPELEAETSVVAVLAHPAVRQHIARGLGSLRRRAPASSTHAARALLLAEPPSVDAGEITDKAYINQCAVLVRRLALVEQLYSESATDAIVPVD